MSIFNEIGEEIQNKVNSTNLKFATRDARSESEAIKMRVRDKMAKLSAQDKESSDYSNLKKIHDKIEANHDEIYLRPEHGVSASQAQEDCEKILSNQEDLEIAFNLAFARLTEDSALLNETQKLQEERKLRDERNKLQQTINDNDNNIKPKPRP